MESNYGIGVNNRYALFFEQDDADGDEVIKAVMAPKTKASAPVSAAKKDAKPAPSTQTAVKKPETGKPARGEDKENRSNRFEGKRILDARKAQDGPKDQRVKDDRNNRRNRALNGEESGPPSTGFGDSQSRPDGESRRGRGGGGRGGFGGERRGDRGERRGVEGGRGPPRGKRDYDRKSGDDRTGVKSVDKREGGGSHNWGTFEDDIKASDDKANTSTDDAAAETAPNDAGDGSGNEEPKEVEPKVMTLDEWKKQQGERSGPKFNLRKAGEGFDLDPKWKKTFAYKKEREVQDDEDDEDHELYPQRVNRLKRITDIEINFADSSRGGPGNAGGRGAGRGNRGGRDRPRGDRPPRNEGEKPRPRGPGKGRGGAEAPNVNDEQSFPSLG